MIVSLAEGAAGTVLLGGRLSFVGGGYVGRVVSQGNLDTGNIGGGYLFPVGEMASSEGLRRNRYRPLILQLGADASDADTVTVSTYTADETMLMDMSWPEDGLSAPTGGGDLLILDTYAPMMWKVEFSAVDPNIRVVADGLGGVNDVRGLRIVRWDCDGTNPELAGDYDATGSLIDDETFSADDRINGIVNITQDAVLVSECNVFGIAANPIGLAPPDPPPVVPMANLQLIHNVVGVVVDVYVDDVRVADDLGYQVGDVIEYGDSGGLSSGPYRGFNGDGQQCAAGDDSGGVCGGWFVHVNCEWQFDESGVSCLIFRQLRRYR